MNIINLNSVPEKFKKAFIFIAVVLIVIELGWLAYLYLPFFKAKSSISTSAPPLPPTLFLSPDSVKIKKGEEFTLSLSVATNGKEIKALDGVIKYDPSVLELIEIPPSAVGIPDQKVFDVYPENKVNRTNGIVTLSAIKNEKKSMSGEAVLGPIKLKTLANLPAETKETAVWLVYRQGASDESNLIDAKTGQDILGQVKHTTIEIR